MLSLTTRIVSCIPSPTNRSLRIESTSWPNPSPGRFRMKNAAEKYSILSEVRSSGRSPLIVRLKFERKRVSSANSPSTLPWRSPSSSQMQNVAPSRILSCSGIPHDPASARLRQRLDDALGDVLGHQGLDSLVDGARLLLVSPEAHAREVRLHEPRIDRRDPDRASEQ